MQLLKILFAFNLAALLVNTLKIHHKMTYTQILRNFYHDDAQMDQIVQNITNDGEKYSNSISFTKNKCQNDSNYPYLTIENSNEANPLEIFIMCNIHARQFISSQICIHFIQQLKQLQIDQPQSPFINNFRYRIFYRANDQRDKAFYQDPLIRKNANNVDLNRNYPTQFNTMNATNTSQIYGGPYPLSENFSQCIEHQIDLKKPIFFLDVHSGEKAFFYQQQFKQISDQYPQLYISKTFSDYRKDHPQIIPILDNLSTQLPIVQDIVAPGGLCNECRVTTLAKDNETLNGHLFADLKIRQQIKYSILFETYGIENAGSSSEQQQTFLQFNPDTKDKIEGIKKQWSDIIFKFLNVIQQNQKQ